MIELYSGTPGSGKSFHATKRIYDILKYTKKNVIANFPINLLKIKNRKGTFYYYNNNELTVKTLVEFAKENHVPCKENQTLIVIDEAGIKFNSRCWQDKDRLNWLDFMSQHRKLGFEIILISQADLMIDKQIRAFIEVEHVHRKMSMNGLGGLLLSPIFTFADIKRWYAMNLGLGLEFIRYKKSIADLYDSFMMFNGE